MNNCGVSSNKFAVGGHDIKKNSKTLSRVVDICGNDAIKCEKSAIAFLRGNIRNVSMYDLHVI